MTGINDTSVPHGKIMIRPIFTLPEDWLEATRVDVRRIFFPFVDVEVAAAVLVALECFCGRNPWIVSFRASS